MLRPCCAGMLCCIALLGQAPAWMHQASCDASHSVGSQPQNAAASTVTAVKASLQSSEHEPHHCGCQHACDSPAAKPQLPDKHSHEGLAPSTHSSGEHHSHHHHQHDHNSGHDHDSGHCAVCYQLATVVGPPVAIVQPSSVEWQVDTVLLPTISREPTRSLSVVNLRGPPTV